SGGCKLPATLGTLRLVRVMPVNANRTRSGYYGRLWQRVQELVQGREIVLGLRVIVVAAGNFEKLLGTGGRCKELLAVGEGNDSVGCAVADEERAGVAANPGKGVVAIAHQQSDRHPGIIRGS